MTQAELADVLNYTDKAVSKWERGEAIPDVTVLKQIADYFGVSVDYLLHKEHKESEGLAHKSAKARSKNRFIITMICAVSVFVLATVAFAVSYYLGAVKPPSWIYFIYAAPVCATVVLVLNSVWGKRRLNFIIVSALLWSLLASVYFTALTVFSLNIWVMFIVGAPAQLVILFIPGLKPTKRKK